MKKSVKFKLKLGDLSNLTESKEVVKFARLGEALHFLYDLEAVKVRINDKITLLYRDKEGDYWKYVSKIGSYEFTKIRDNFTLET